MDDTFCCCGSFAECYVKKECVRKYSKYEQIRSENGEGCNYNNYVLKKNNLVYSKSTNCANCIRPNTSKQH